MSTTELRALHEAATPGPWHYLSEQDIIATPSTWYDEDGAHTDLRYPRVIAHIPDDWDQQANAALITYLRNAVPDILALIEERDRLRDDNEQLRKMLTIPSDVADLVERIGPAEWGATAPLDCNGHADNTANSVRLTAKHFTQDGPQPMHGLYVKGTETVICQTGTSPNSPGIARALTGAWNWLRDCSLREQARAALAGEKP